MENKRINCENIFQKKILNLLISLNDNRIDKQFNSVKISFIIDL